MVGWLRLGVYLARLSIVAELIRCLIWQLIGGMMAFVPGKPVLLGMNRAGKPQQQNETPPQPTPNRNQARPRYGGKQGLRWSIGGLGKL